VSKKKTTTPEAKAKRTRPPAKRESLRQAQASGKPRKATKTARSAAADPGARSSGWARTAAAYASLGLAKGLRVAATTIGKARGAKRP
jgi:hypothetical protein